MRCFRTENVLVFAFRLLREMQSRHTYRLQGNGADQAGRQQRRAGDVLVDIGLSVSAGRRGLRVSDDAVGP